MVTFDNKNHKYTIEVRGNVEDWERTMKSMLILMNNIDCDNGTGHWLFDAIKDVSGFLEEMIPDSGILLNGIDNK